MALHEEISNQAIELCVNAIPSKYFTTLKVISELERRFPEDVKRIKSYSERNWRAVIGKAIKRFSVETNLIKQVSEAKESPARWEKIK
jgi:hypothetical protein